MRITASAVAGCTGGRVAGGDAEADGLSFDTRTLVPGEAFVALVADRDGHDHLGAAIAAGAPFAIVERGRAVDGLVCVEVDDTLVALAAVGGMWYVMGSSSEMVATGPMPGSTPIAVPMMQPIRQNSRLLKVSATLKPCARLAMRSMVPCLPDQSCGQSGTRISK